MIKAACNRVRVWTNRPYTEEEERVNRIALWFYGIVIAAVIYIHLFLTVMERTAGASWHG